MTTRGNTRGTRSASNDRRPGYTYHCPVVAIVVDAQVATSLVQAVFVESPGRWLARKGETPSFTVFWTSFPLAASHTLRLFCREKKTFGFASHGARTTH